MNIFKRYIKLLLPLTLLAVAAGCKDEISIPELELSETVITAEEQSVTLDIKVDGAWELKNSEEVWGTDPDTQEKYFINDGWLTPSIKAGSGNTSVTFEVTDNNTFEDRASIITVTGSGGWQRLLLTQKAAVMTLSLQKIEFDEVGTPVSITITTQKSWKINNSADAPWCAFSAVKGGGGSVITLTPEPFDNTVSRGPNEIEFESGGQKKILTISQEFSLVSAPSLLEPADRAQEVAIKPTFKWMPSTNHEGGNVFYDVEVSSDLTTWTILATDLTATEYAASEPLMRGQNYWRVTASDGIDSRKSSAIFSFNVVGLGQATLVSPADGLGNVTDFTLRWSPPTGVDYGITYSVAISKDGTADWVTKATGLTTASYTLTETYSPWTYWKVIANDNLGGESESEIFRFTTGEQTSYIDGEWRLWKNNSVAGVAPIHLVIMGDGFIEEDYVYGGNFDKEVDEIMTGFFEVEPFKTYKDYFRVTKVAAFSQERGATVLANMTTGGINVPKQTRNTVFNSQLAGGSSTNVSNPVDVNNSNTGTNLIYEYAKKVPGITDENLNDVSVFLMVNIEAFAGTTTVNRNGRSIGRTCLDANKTKRMIHEAGGHGFGRLKDEYITYSGSIPQEDIDRINLYRNEKGDPFWYAGNIDVTGSREQTHWKHYFTIPGYERVTMIEGAYEYPLGAWRAEEKSIMQGSNHMLYFNAPSREAIVRRIARIGGFAFNFANFLAKDDNTMPPTSRSMVERIYPHDPPEDVE